VNGAVQIIECCVGHLLPAPGLGEQVGERRDPVLVVAVVGDHALPGVGSNYAAQEATLADTLITLTNSVTVTDGDGDTATDSEVLNIGANIKFDDDGPSVSLSAPTDTVLLNTQDAQTIGANTDSDTQAFAAAFGTASTSYGADGPGTTTSSFTLGVATQGGDSGLKSDGATIYLYLLNGKVILRCARMRCRLSRASAITDWWRMGSPQRLPP